MTETSGQPSAPADPSTPPAERPRHPVRELLGEAEFLKVWGIGALAGSMRWLEVLATGIYVYEVTGMAVVVSVILMARTLPMFVFGFVFGTAAERMDRRWMFRVAMVTMAVNTAGLAVLAWSGEIEVWHIFLGALINGIAWATDFPVRRTIIGFIAGEKRVGSAMSLDSATTNVTRMTGPMLGGLLYETIGLPGAFAVAAGCYGICAVIAMLTHGGAGEGARSKASGEQEGFFASLKAGLSGLRGRDGLIAVLAVTVAMNLFGFPYAALIPALGEHRFQIDAFLTGVLMSAEGMGATIGAFVIAVVARPAWFRRVYFIGALTFLSSIMVMSQISS
ncbi:MAG: MFS transporter, partial [Rhodospirillaceae bacterium]|nr:MFS transporter [Rhodospirillaceae bacterium]